MYVHLAGTYQRTYKITLTILINTMTFRRVIDSTEPSTTRRGTFWVKLNSYCLIIIFFFFVV